MAYTYRHVAAEATRGENTVHHVASKYPSTLPACHATCRETNRVCGSKGSSTHSVTRHSHWPQIRQRNIHVLMITCATVQCKIQSIVLREADSRSATVGACHGCLELAVQRTGAKRVILTRTHHKRCKRSTRKQHRMQIPRSAEKLRKKVQRSGKRRASV